MEHEEEAGEAEVVEVVEDTTEEDTEEDTEADTVEDTEEASKWSERKASLTGTFMAGLETIKGRSGS